MAISELSLFLPFAASQIYHRWFPSAKLSCVQKLYSQIETDRDIFENLLVDSDPLVWEDFIYCCIEYGGDSFNWLKELSYWHSDVVLKLSNAIHHHMVGVRLAGATTVSILSDFYPIKLRQISKPPLILTCLGDFRKLSTTCISVVGSRQASWVASQYSFHIGKIAADLGWGVVSGGALGCDIAAHQGMLASSQRDIHAVVILAGGLYHLYPKRNSAIFNQLIERGGVIVSERLWSQIAIPRDFPIRNRIVSGMSSAVIVTQAAEKSGSLITADEALEQGRDVYCFDNKESDVRFLGSQRLIEDGATRFFSPEELFIKYLIPTLT
ncbi:MAG: DNA-protecting protein DprA [Proteobacteria bacterium]|nr:DNA-protecting protein DprA [Pseudomonadota bacterium]